MSDVPVQVRTIRTEAHRVGEDELEVVGRLVDERPQGGPRWFDEEGASPVIHDMTVTLRVRYPELVITHARGAMAAHPYTLCVDALPPLDRLVGLSVVQGFTRAVNERFGRQLGCAHLTALVQAMAPVIRQAAGAAFRHDAEPPRADRDRWFVNTCQAWREGGPLHAALERGDLAAIRKLSARRR